MSSNADAPRTYDESDHDGASSLASDPNEKPKATTIAQNETKAVSGLRIAVLLVLAGAALAVAGLTYVNMKNAEREDFESSFEDQALKVIETFEGTGKSRLRAIQSLSQQITSHALSSGESFPRVTVPNFETLATTTAKLADVLAIVYWPFVQKEDRDIWEEYSWEHRNWTLESAETVAIEEAMKNAPTRHLQDWENRTHGLESTHNSVNPDLDPRLARQARDPANEDEWMNAMSPIIHRMNFTTGGFSADLEEEGPYFPFWQWAPFVPLVYLVNLNAR